MAASVAAKYPSASDIIEIKWLSSHTKERIKVESITNASITIQYLDNNDIEEFQFDHGQLPFEWQLIEKHIDKEKEKQNIENNANQFYDNKGNKWQTKAKHSQHIEQNPDYFQRKRQEYDGSHSQRINQTQTANQMPSNPKMKKKEIPQQRDIVRSLSALTTSTNSEHKSQPQPPAYRHNNNAYNVGFSPHPSSKQIAIDSSRLPLKGDTVEICYAGGSQNDPVRIIHCNYFGKARVRYADAKGAENKINLFTNNDVKWTITKSVFHSPDFIPAPRKGDLVEIHWIENGGSDHALILDIEAIADDHCHSKQSETECSINHFAKFQSIWVTFEYPDDHEKERLDFHPKAADSEILSWRILQSSTTAGLRCDTYTESKSPAEAKNGQTEPPHYPINDELCTVCCTPFHEFPYRTVVPCAHNNVCAKCTIRMRVFFNFNSKKQPYAICPFCKESWQTVAIIPLSWTIAIRAQYSKQETKSTLSLSKYESNIVYAHPLEYDDEISCYFTDIDTLQKFIHIRSLYCVLCVPKVINYNKIFYFHNVGKLLGHLRYEHTSFMCELCLNNATLFIDEQRIFMNDKRLLLAHLRNGSPIEEDYGETQPHPFCTLCRENFYSREALYEHCEDTHCSCHLCKQSGILEYYKSAEVLTQHHKELHHLCLHPACLAKLQSVVFDDPVLLNSHQSQAHGWNKPVSAVRTAFTYGDEMKNAVGGQGHTTMNFSTMFSQNDINEMNSSRYAFYADDSQPQKQIVVSEEERLRRRQKQMHRRMDETMQRWFPNSYKQQKRSKQLQNLGLRHIPDAIASVASLREEKNAAVIAQIRTTLVSEGNFGRFQQISSAYSNKKISSLVFFHRFKKLFAPLCGEKMWVDILMQMLALLRDATKRRSLYEQYRDWVIGGRVNQTTKIRSGLPKKAKKTNVKSAATIVAGTYKPLTQEMIVSQRRSQRGKNKRQNSNKPKVVSSAKNVKGKWKTGAPQIVKKKPQKKTRDKNIPKISSKAPAVKKHWPTLAVDKNAPKKVANAPKNIPKAAPTKTKNAAKNAPKWVDKSAAKTVAKPAAKKAAKPSPKNIAKKRAKPSPKNVPKNRAKSPPKNRPKTAPKNRTKTAPKNVPKWVDKSQTNKSKQLTIKNKPIPIAIQSKPISTASTKKTKRGARKHKKSKQSSDKIEIFKPINTTNNKNQSKTETAPPPKKPAIKMPPKGKMPHLKQKEKSFNKSNPWGAAHKSPPPKPIDESNETQIETHEKEKHQTKPKKNKKKATEQKNDKKATKANNQNDKNKQKNGKNKKVKADNQKHAKKDQADNQKQENKYESKEDTIERIHIPTALHELELTLIRLSRFKKTLYLDDKIGLFLCFLFESLFVLLKANITTFKTELTNVWKQHIYQTVYDQFWCKIELNPDTNLKTIKFESPSYKIRPNENLLSYSPFLCNLPELNENIAIQFGALYDIFGAIAMDCSCDEIDFEPLQPWISQMELSFNAIYCVLLYLWLILDVEIPASPYKCIVPKKIAPKTDQDHQNNTNQNKKQNQAKKKNKAKQKQKKHKAKKPVVLFKMGGM